MTLNIKGTSSEEGRTGRSPYNVWRLAGYQFGGSLSFVSLVLTEVGGGKRVRHWASGTEVRSEGFSH